MKTEEKLVRQYFGFGEGTITEHDIMDKERMKEHMDWHEMPENKTKSGNYGERFLLFHKQYIEKFDTFRISNGYLPVSSWDPSTKIPDRFAHEGYIERRFTDDPTRSDPLCRTPTWLTPTGGSDPDPKYGYTVLYQFRSIDELGWAIDPIYNSWHNRIHNTIGGDMQKYHSPIDPIFWPWHKWVDEIRATWWTWRVSHAVIGRNLAPFLERVARLLHETSVGRSDVHAITGEKIATEPPHFPFLLYDSRSTIDALMGLVINQISYQISDSKSSESLQKIAIKLLNNAAEHISVQSVNTKSKKIEKANKSK